MKRTFLSVLSLLITCVVPLSAQDQKAPEQVDMAEMMKRAKQFTQPGKNHELLKRFLGTWETELRVTMVGAASKPEKGTATFSWLMEGRWIQSAATGTMMGLPAQSFMILGYDNFKMSYVTVSVSTMDTAMLVSEGDMDPSGRARITYGTLDEYLTGEHDKMVRYVWRFLSDDEMALEIHDLPIGEKNTQVVEIVYKRRK